MHLRGYPNVYIHVDYNLFMLWKYVLRVYCDLPGKVVNVVIRKTFYLLVYILIIRVYGCVVC